MFRLLETIFRLNARHCNIYMYMYTFYVQPEHGF
jgi:hypothetical protein